MPEPARRYPGHPDRHRAWLPVSAQSWRRSGCRCDGCHGAEGQRRYRDLAVATKPIQVYGRKYTVTERLAIGMAMAAPGGLAVAAEVRAWLDAQAELAVADATWTMYERLAMEQARLEGD